MKSVLLCCFLLGISFVKSENSLSKKEISEYYEQIIKSITKTPTHSGESFESEILGNPEISTENGIITGVTYPESHAFYSIPYAQPPIGELRFKPPVKAVPSPTLNASVADYVRCYEFRGLSEEDFLTEYYSEDCLLLNVNVPSSFDPTTPTTERLPVMFWLHGGAFFAGAGTSRTYDGRYLSNVTNTIIVSVNYRLDAFGFLVYDDEEDSFDGNQGFKDQQLALEWVRDNIEYFGGDKEMVTIFGQSAGAQSVNLHLMSDKSKPLFKRAIMQSNPAAFYYQNKNEAKSKAEALLKYLNCTNIECLKSVQPDDIISAHLAVALSEPRNFFNVIEPYRPVIDEDIKEQPLAYFRSGNWQNDKEVMIGTTSEEAAYVYGIFENMNERRFKVLTNLVVGTEFATKVIDKYIPLLDESLEESLGYKTLLEQEVTDMVFGCSSRNLARSMSSTSLTDEAHPAVYYYIDSHPLEGPNCQNVSNYCGYAFHGSEVSLVFNNGPGIGYVFNDNDTLVAEMFNDFWGNFTYTGKPTDDLSLWPYYTEQSLTSPVIPWSNIRIQAPQSFVESGYRADICDFWDDLGIYVDSIETTSSSMDESTIRTSTLETKLTTNEETTQDQVGETTFESGMESTTTGSSATLKINNFVLSLSFMFVYLLKLI